MGKTKDLGHLAHIVAYNAENHITVPAGITMHTNQLVASQSYVTTALGSYALSSSLGSYVPTSRTITINGTTLDLSADRSFTIAAGLSSFNTRTGDVTLSSSDVTTALGYTPVTNARTITINGTTWDLSANRSFTVSAGTTLNGTGFVKASGTTITYDNSTYLTGITSALVTGALGFTPYNATNPSGFITSSSNITGTASGNVLSRGQSNWSGSGVIDNVVGLLAWKNYNNSHVIFDASNGTSPSGTGVSQTNATNAWSASYPTLMGWNGGSTYGVRVDSARIADSASSVAWTNVSGRPTALSQFSNDLGNYGGWITSAGQANSLSPNYAGGVQGNPQVYFNNGIGLKVAMTGSWSVWSDTLWVNGYTGGDVPWMCALHFLRNSEPRFAISAQTQGSTSYGGYYEVITAYNIASQTVSKLNPLSGDGNYKLAYTADGARTNAGEWGRAVMYYVPNGQTYGIRVDRADVANSISGQANSATINATSGNAGNNIVLRDGSGDIAISTLNANHALFGGGGRGITSADTYGSYGNVMTYGTGQNGYSGYGIYDNAGYRTFFMGESGNFGIYGQTIGQWAFYYANSTASYAIGSSSPVPGYTLYLIYGLYTVGLYNASDARMKKDIKPLSSSLDKVKQLRGVSYEYIDKGEDGTKNKGLELGFIAQEVLPIIPELIRYDEKKGYAMNYNGVSAVLVEAVKEQQVQIEAQQTQIENQQNQINTLISQLTELLNK